MQKYPVTFSRNPVMFLILIIIPLLVTAVFLVPVLWLPRFPDWLVLVHSVALMGVALACTLFAVKHWASTPAEASLDEAGILITLQQGSPFYLRKEYKSTWEGVDNVSTNLDPQHNKRFYLLSFRNPATTVNLMPADAADEDTETPFGEVLLNYVQQYNTSHQGHPEAIIRQKGFYDTWWAKALTVCAYVCMIAVLVAYFTDRERLPFWKLIQVCAFSALWLAAFYANQRKNKQ
jgi:hypothetical protein